MRIFCKLVATATITLSLIGCTRQQQSAISSSDWQRNLSKAIDDVTKAAGSKLQHTENWLSTETEINKLQSTIRTWSDNGSVTDTQAASLRNSLDYIRRLQQRSINSDEGIDATERAQIAAAVDRVEKRLKGWLAAKSSPTM